MTKFESGKLARMLWEALRKSGVELNTAHLNIVDNVFTEYAAQQGVQADGACACPDNGNLQINSDFVCAVCGKTPRR